MSEKGPFGLWMGMKVEDFTCSLTEIQTCKFRANEVPKPHSAFQWYGLLITPGQGLAWAKAIGKPIESGVHGYEIRAAFDAMEAKLAATYGRHKRHDFLLEGSIWNEPRDWMGAFLQKERILAAEWSRQNGSTLPDALSIVYLGVDIQDSSTGNIIIEYSFANVDAAEAELAAAEDDAL